MDLSHESKGKGNNRHIVVSNEKTKKEEKEGKEKMGEVNLKEYVFYSGYIGLKGATIDYAANKHKTKVNKELIKKRVERDGEEHHITLITKKELEIILLQLKEYDKEKYDSIKITHVASFLMKLFVSSVKNDWFDVGLGRVVDGDNEAFFVVVSFDSLNDWRRNVLGLDFRDIHITLGFQTCDIHNQKKDKSTLVENCN